MSIIKIFFFVSSYDILSIVISRSLSLFRLYQHDIKFLFIYMSSLPCSVRLNHSDVFHHYQVDTWNLRWDVFVAWLKEILIKYEWLSIAFNMKVSTSFIKGLTRKKSAKQKKNTCLSFKPASNTEQRFETENCKMRELRAQSSCYSLFHKSWNENYILSNSTMLELVIRNLKNPFFVVLEKLVLS
jgi:hypothetical protein